MVINRALTGVGSPGIDGEDDRRSRTTGMPGKQGRMTAQEIYTIPVQIHPMYQRFLTPK